MLPALLPALASALPVVALSCASPDQCLVKLVMGVVRCLLGGC